MRSYGLSRYQAIRFPAVVVLEALLLPAIGLPDAGALVLAASRLLGRKPILSGGKWGSVPGAAVSQGDATISGVAVVATAATTGPAPGRIIEIGADTVTLA